MASLPSRTHKPKHRTHRRTKDAEKLQQALQRARSGASIQNMVQVIQGFTSRGIAEDQIRPYENVLTYDAWLALGRHVRRGEHGVKVMTMVDLEAKKDDATGEVLKPARRFRKNTTVFHVSQTEIS